MQGLVADPWIQAQIDAAVAPYSGRLPPEEIAWMREQLAEALVSEKLGRDLMRRARPRFVERSGEVACEPIDESDAAKKAATRRAAG